MPRYPWLWLAAALPIACVDRTSWYRLDASSNAAVVESIDAMTAGMGAAERRAFREDVQAALAQGAPGEIIFCGTFITQWRDGRDYPTAAHVQALHGHTFAEIRAQAAAVRKAAKRLEAERVVLQAEDDRLRPAVDAYHAGSLALAAFVRQAELVWSDPSRPRLRLHVRNATSRPVSEVELMAYVSCRGCRSVEMTYRAPQPVAPGGEATWEVPVPAGSPLLEPAPRVDGPANVYCTRLADPHGAVIHEKVAGEELRAALARSAILRQRLLEIGWPGQHLR
jgi:hypothetical protein